MVIDDGFGIYESCNVSAAIHPSKNHYKKLVLSISLLFVFCIFGFSIREESEKESKGLIPLAKSD